MKKVLIAFLFLTGIIFSAQTAHAQVQKPVKGKNEVFKTSIQKVPGEVQQTLKKYANKKFDSKVTYTREKGQKLYKIRVTNDKWIDYMLIDESGKVKGIEYGEGKGRG